MAAASSRSHRHRISADIAANRTRIATTHRTRVGRSGGGARDAARSFGKPQVGELVTKPEDLRLQGRTGSKTGGYQSEKGDQKRDHRGKHRDLSIDRNLFVFRSDGIFGSHSKISAPSFRGFGPAVHGQTNLDGPHSGLCAKAPKSQLTPAMRILPLMSAYM